MKLFLRNILYFSILLCVICLLADECITRGLHKSTYWEFASWNEIYQQPIHADLIVQGTSRAKVHIDTRILDSMLRLNTYNLGINGNDINVQLCKYRIYLKNNKKPRYIIQNVDMETLALRKNITENLQFIPYLRDTMLSNTLKNYRAITWEDQYLPLFRYRGRYEICGRGVAEYFNIASPDTSSINIKGFAPQYRVWDSTKISTNLEKEGIKTEIDKEAVLIFENFLAQCQRENTVLVMVYTPLYHTLPHDKGVKEKFATFAKQYNAIFLDYTHIDLCNDQSKFYNYTHLNAEGARQFSTILANDLKTILSK